MQWRVAGDSKLVRETAALPPEPAVCELSAAGAG